MRILQLGPQFRPKTSHVYPPFKNGRYMEEYAYDYLIGKETPVFVAYNLRCDSVYIPIFWTNLQNHPGFLQMKAAYNALLRTALLKEEQAMKDANVDKPSYFTIVQHDDGPQLDLPPHTIIFGACTGTLPLPLIYEDVGNTLLYQPRIAKDILASFVGSITHPVRNAMLAAVDQHADIICYGKKEWSSHISPDRSDQFIAITLRSKFCLAPRGYGRSSFRFFEAMLLDVIPVYIWDDKCWLPYQDDINYDTFSVSIHVDQIAQLHDILLAISDEKYEQMLMTMRRVRSMFSLEHMCKYIIRWI